MGTQAMAGMSRLAVAEKNGEILADFFPVGQSTQQERETGRAMFLEGCVCLSRR